MRRASKAPLWMILVSLAASAHAREAGTDSGAAPGPLGAACKTSSDCGDPGLTCVTPSGGDLGGKGPAGGLCTVTCTSNLDCAAWDPSAQCLHYKGAANSYCLEGCSHDDWYEPELNPRKCHGRLDMACGGTEYGLLDNACRPTCTSDSQCGPGLTCNGVYGLCQSDPKPGDPIGSTCDPSQSPTTCQGFCSAYANGTAYCDALCVIGSRENCGYTGVGTPKAACLSYFTGGGQSTGDLGSCAQLCRCDADCTAAGFVCRPNALSLSFGARGTCTPADYAATSLPSCEVDAGDLGACVYGMTRACHGLDGCLGAASCRADRSGYESCRCTTVSASDAGSRPSKSLPDAGSNEPDAGAPPSRHGSTPPSGCGCRVSERSGSGASSLALSALLLLVRRKRSPRRR